MNYDNLQIDMHGPVAVLTVARPEKLNALNHRTITELHRAFEAFANEAGVRAVVVTGAGDKAFVAGADIAEIRDQTPLDARHFSERGQRLMRRIETMTKPVIAAINGYCLGGGLELALACHIRYAAENARLGLPEIKLGILPGFGGTQRLSRLLGRSRALEMILTGEPVDARTAEAYGIVQGVVGAGEVSDHALALAQRLASAAPHAIAAILETVDKGLDMPLEQGLGFETARFALCCATDDMREGTAAFLEKRKPDFRAVDTIDPLDFERGRLMNLVARPGYNPDRSASEGKALGFSSPGLPAYCISPARIHASMRLDCGGSGQVVYALNAHGGL